MTRLDSGLAGLTAAGAGLAAGQVLGALVAPGSAPLVAVGSAVIDLAPPALKEWAASTLGTADKAVLVAVVALAVGVLGVLAGLGSRRWRPLGDLTAALLGATGIAAALTRPDAGPLAFLPSLAAALVAAGILRWHHRRASTLSHPPDHAGPDRRLVLTAGAGVAAAAVTATFSGAGGRPPAGVTLPSAATPAPPLPAGLESTVAGVTPLRTPVKDFYRIDTALLVPQLDPGAWRLDVTGMVARPFSLSWDELLALPMIERDITLTCVSNEIGGPYCGSTRWTGVRVADLLTRAQPSPGADQVLSASTDGFTASTPLTVLLDGRDAMVAIAMDGRPLTPEHGFPARLVTPGLYGYVGATKWLTRLTVTTFAAQQAYWTTRGWAEQAPVKTATRIDTPTGRILAGATVVAGVAWATHRGVSRVQVQVDGGPWQDARLGPDVGLDYWRQWYLPWNATSGRHRLAARAFDGSGVPQPAAVQGVLPDGPTGYHVVDVEVA